MSQYPRVENPTEKKIQQKRRMPRIALSQEQFRLTENGKIFSVINLSLEGLALKILETKDSFLFPIGRDVSGFLKIEDQKIPLKLQVVHIDRHLAGCSFVDSQEESLTSLRSLLNAEFIGKRIKSMPSFENKGFWFHGPFSTEIVVRKKQNGNIHELSIVSLGHFIYWSEKKGLATGLAEDTASLDADSALVHVNPLTVIFDDSPDLMRLAEAKKLLSASPIEANLKAWCLQQIEI